MPAMTSTYGFHLVFGTRTTPPRATYSCPCGHVQRATGPDQVVALLDDNGSAHQRSCPLREDRGVAR